ncbi:MAG: WbqC family protein [Sediminibacterium sp.]
MLPLRIESQYFGSVQYIKQIAKANSAVIDIHEPFKKMSYRNRTTIVSAQGPLLLTVPLQNGRDQKLPIHEVKISYSENWPSKHIKALSSCYKRSPFFEYYEDGLSRLLKTEYPYLLDLNMQIVEWLSKVLKTEFNISKTTEATSYLDPNFIDVRDTSNMSKLSQNIANQVYPQVFSDKIEFIPNASILDLLFCMGPSANIYLKDKHL